MVTFRDAGGAGLGDGEAAAVAVETGAGVDVLAACQGAFADR
jgi:hypothetical protein